MKRIVFCFVHFLSLYAVGQKTDTVVINSTEMNEPRKLVVYTPPEYSYFTTQKFEVIYLFDAQARQYLDMVSATMRFQDSRTFPMIIVGVISPNRNKDFLPVNDYKETAERYNGYLGNADKLMRFLAKEVVPAIDSSYRTLSKRMAIGHSNGAAFITYCLLEQPDLFDAYIAISPNFGYDKMQFTRRFKNFNVNKLTSKKFFYMCNSGGYPEEGDWITGRKQVLNLFNSAAYKNKFIFKNQDFSTTENHSTVFQVGLIDGLKEYFNYQYFTAENLIAYYEALYTKGQIELTPKNTNQLAYNVHFTGRTAEAVKVLLWAHRHFPEDLNLFDSIGEMYQTLNKKEDARKYYLLLGQKIEQQKTILKSDDYERKKKGVEDRLNSLK